MVTDMSGPEEYLRLVDTLPISLLNEAPLQLSEMQLDPNAPTPFDMPGQTALSIFASRLAFLAEFRDYLLFNTQGAKDRASDKMVSLITAGIAPVGFWAVLLVESIPLLEGQSLGYES